MSNSLVSFRDAVNTTSVVSTNERIRDIIRDVLNQKDEKLWTLIQPRLQPPGRGGSTQYDHAAVAFAVIAAAPLLSEIKGLSEIAVYNHTVSVLRKRGFTFARGYITGHVNDNAADDDNAEAPEVPEAAVSTPPVEVE